MRAVFANGHFGGWFRGLSFVANDWGVYVFGVGFVLAGDRFVVAYFGFGSRFYWSVSGLAANVVDGID